MDLAAADLGSASTLGLSVHSVPAVEARLASLEVRAMRFTPYASVSALNCSEREVIEVSIQKR